MSLRRMLSAAVVCVCVAPIVLAQDAVKTDPKHYTVISENDQVRILKVHYGAHEKSIMHSHPNGVAVFLNDGSARFTFPDGKTQDVPAKAGDAQYTPATVHLPENTGDTPFDVIVIEFKGKMGTAKAK